MRLQSWLLSLGALVLVAGVAPEARAQKKPVKFTQQWKGSVDDEAQLRGAPECITSAKALEKLWKAWKIEGNVPKVDFDKEIVVVGTTRGSKLILSATLDANDNLEVLGVATRDLLPGFRYVLATVSREGVKTVNKKNLPID
jgi:hypothetical protein